MYEIGELDKRVTIKREAQTADGAGGSFLSWTTVATRWAHIRPNSGNERTAADGIEAAASYLFVIRQGTPVFENDRLDWDGVEFNVRFVAYRGNRSQYLEIQADRGVAV